MTIEEARNVLRFAGWMNPIQAGKVREKIREKFPELYPENCVCFNCDLFVAGVCPAGCEDFEEVEDEYFSAI